MIPHFKNTPGLNHGNGIRLANRRKTVGNDQTRPSRKKVFQGQLDVFFRGRIHARGGLIEDKNRGIFKKSPRNGKSLALPST